MATTSTNPTPFGLFREHLVFKREWYQDRFLLAENMDALNLKRQVNNLDELIARLDEVLAEENKIREDFRSSSDLFSINQNSFNERLYISKQ